MPRRSLNNTDSVIRSQLKIIIFNMFCDVCNKKSVEMKQKANMFTINCQEIRITAAGEFTNYN